MPLFCGREEWRRCGEKNRDEKRRWRFTTRSDPFQNSKVTPLLGLWDTWGDGWFYISQIHPFSGCVCEGFPEEISLWMVDSIQSVESLDRIKGRRRRRNSSLFFLPLWLNWASHLAISCLQTGCLYHRLPGSQALLQTHTESPHGLSWASLQPADRENSASMITWANSS